MINRILIRMKVLQTLYAYEMTKADKTPAQALRELNTALERSYELYMSLLKLVIDLTDMQDRVLDDARHKYRATYEDLYPNMKFVSNALPAMLRNDDTLMTYCEQNHISWHDEVIFMRHLLDVVTHSEVYNDYMNAGPASQHKDCELWKALFRQIILCDEDLIELLENRSVYWNIEDVDIAGQFVVKTIRRFDEGETPAMLPMYRQDDDHDFARQLLDSAITHQQQANELIDNCVIQQNWDAARIAVVDRIIMQVAVAELLEFESIPTTVTLNEYIELAKNFSTAASGQFVNGVLNNIVNRLKADKTINKP